MPAQWTAITVTYNSAATLERCWAAYDGSFEWLVVDNASTDNSAAVAESLGARVVRLPANVGFSRANNVGLARVATPYVAFVNPDVVVEPDGLSRLAETVELHSAIVAPQLMSTDGSDQPNARGLPFMIDKLANRGIRLPFSRLDSYTPRAGQTPVAVDWLMGAVVSATTDTFRSIGGWNEGYFVYYEDHELGLRAWSKGVPVILDPKVRWIHEWSRDTARWSPIHWRHEIASASRFYASHPLLLLPWRSTARNWYGASSRHRRDQP